MTNAGLLQTYKAGLRARIVALSETLLRIEQIEDETALDMINERVAELVASGMAKAEALETAGLEILPAIETERRKAEREARLSK